jgi:hypothetical protein
MPSKSKLLLLLLLCTSCIGSSKLINTEILCPNRPGILIKFANAEEMKYQAYKDYLYVKNSERKRNYTLFRLEDGRSFAVKIAPERILNCHFKQSPFGMVDGNYVHSF